MKTVVVVLLISLSGCNDADRLNELCPETCYNGPTGTEGVGQCRAGKPVCDEDMNVVECVGEVLPSEEVCDGRDNLCRTGIADEDLQDVRNLVFDQLFPNDNNPCVSVHGECYKAKIDCIGGKWFCEYPDTVEVGSNGLPLDHETLCDLRDGDCSGAVDDNLFEGEYCYSGPIGTEQGACHPGFLKCVDGDVMCVGEVLPAEEQCDALDHDCDGVAGDTDDLKDRKYDIVFAIDTSFSMCDKISAVVGALQNYVLQFTGNANFRWAIVIMSGTTFNRVQKILDFSDIAVLQSTLSMMQCDGYGYEASIDVINEVCMKQDSNVLDLSWRTDADALVFSFTDEMAQTYTQPETTAGQTVDACLSHGVVPFQWAYDFVLRDIVVQSGGKFFTLTSDYRVILDNLNTILASLCGI